MRILVSSEVEVMGCPLALTEALRRRLTFDNPAYIEAKRMERSTRGIPPILRFFKERGRALIVPRGMARWIVTTAREDGIPCEIDDRRRSCPAVAFSFKGALRDYQNEAVRAILARDFGVLTAPTGSGKTVMALAVVAKRRQPTLIIVHTRELAEQWAARIETFLGIPREEVGRIGGGKRIVAPITVAMVQTLYKCVDEVAPRFGHLIVDECHRAPARTFTEAVSAFDCRYMLGLSATPWRRDKLSKLIYYFLGDKVYEVERDRLLQSRAILPAELVIRKTSFTAISDPTENYPAALTELTENPERNALIVDDVFDLCKTIPGTILVLSDRKDHLATLAKLIRIRGEACAILTGDLPKKKRIQIVNSLNRGKVRILLATGQLVGEGFDCPNLHALVLATPVRFSGRVIQYLGRVLRPADGKDKAIVVDYCDELEGVFQHSFLKRQALFQTFMGTKENSNDERSEAAVGASR
jgi:superfamily II DNA or RNA helicase